MSITFAVIGGGNMAKAIVEGAGSGGVLCADTIVVADPEQSSRDFFDTLGCHTTSSSSSLPETAHVLLSVKPQVFAAIADDIKSDIVYSIMAGVTIKKIANATGNNRIVRMMPNLPCSIGYGATGLAIADSTQEDDATLAKEIFSQIGSVIEVSETLMDAVTAVSGSGPAYVFYLAEAMLEGGIKVGLDIETADALVRQTILGAAALLLQDERSAKELKEAVTSEGGTTAAALHVLKAANVRKAIEEAVVSARDRGRELSN
jgi:pyrroline-5-carboxylate reductase